MARRALLCAALCAFTLTIATSPAHAASRNVAALQVALHAQQLYTGDVDGVLGPGTATALRSFQRRRGLVADGIPGPQTRRALGRLGRHRFGSRTMHLGQQGWDVAALQYALSAQGFPCGPLDGTFGAHVRAALVRFQSFAGLPQVGFAGPATRGALRRSPLRPPLPVARPVDAPIGDAYGARGTTWHPGIDYPAPAGAAVVSARSGVVTVAGFAADGYGNRVVISHGLGEQTLYAHLSAVLVAPGASVTSGALIGRVGSTGFSTGPHLHFEVIVRGAKVDPAS